MKFLIKAFLLSFVLIQVAQAGRMYDPEIGRFIQRDPLGYVDGMSLYNAYFAEGFNLDPSGTDNYWIGGAADKAKYLGSGPTHIMKYVMEDRKGSFPAQHDNHYYGYYEEDKIVTDIISRRTSEAIANYSVTSMMPCVKVKVVNIIGHSLGGHAAMRITNKLKDHGIKVNVLITLDPVKYPMNWWATGADNQSWWGNSYQSLSIADGIANLPVVGQLVAGGLSAFASEYGDAVATLGGSIGSENGADKNSSKSYVKLAKSITHNKGTQWEREQKYQESSMSWDYNGVKQTGPIPDYSHMHAKSFFDDIIKSVPANFKNKVWE